ncbi:DNA polymerase beta superfamily protein [Exiguobacterium sp. s140]|uniref:DNA polymerase beta superfamily protein n=1 Tax=Exiguobacterium sp. s140 TaxID=2751290 RepID=UPI001BE67F9D|nr:nucleotidyltransferase domain-containing protein [Exiguobacterium sp. s140]
MSEKVFTTSELKELKEFEGRQVVLVAKIGSENYNLHDETSDEDYRIYVLPTFEDLYGGKRYVKSVTSETVDYSVHDIRDLAKQLMKSNINFVEALFSVDLTVKHDVVEEMLKMRENIAKMNLPYFYDACFGMFHNKLKHFESSSRESNRYVVAYGYDTKAFMSMYRMMDFILRYEANGFSSFVDAIRYSEEERAYLLSMKHGRFTKTEAENLIQLMKDKVQGVKPAYKGQPFQSETETELNKLLFDTVKNHIQH